MILTEKEDHLVSELISLTSLRTLDFSSQDNMEIFNITQDVNYNNPVQAIIDSENDIINTLELDKVSITEKLLVKEENFSFANDNDDATEVTEDTSTEEEIDEELIEWNKIEFLGAALDRLEGYFIELEYVNEDLTSMSADLNFAYELLNDIELTMGDMDNMIKDPETGKHLAENEKDTIKKMLKNINGVIYTEEQLIEQAYYSNDVISNEEIKEVQADVSDIITDIELLKAK